MIKFFKPFACVIAFSVSACVPTTPGGATGAPSATPSLSPSPSVQPGPDLPGESASPSPTPLPGASAVPGDELPPQLSELRFGAIDRFLDSRGEHTRFAVELLDANGQIIAAQVPLEWRSSRPQDFSVADDGQVTALVDFGYSTISVQIPGTAFVAQAVINVSAGGGTGGSSKGPAPTPSVSVSLLEGGYY